jgi:hypothetical protein
VPADPQADDGHEEGIGDEQEERQAHRRSRAAG